MGPLKLMSTDVIDTLSPEPSTLPGHAAGRDLKRVRVYIAEDHSALRQLLATHLAASACYEVVGQTDRGWEAILACQQLRPQVLILDLDLPDENGLEVLTAVRAQTPGTQILVFSALTDPGTVRRALERGAAGFVEKTAGIDTLDRAIAAVSLGQTFFGDHILQTLPALLRGETASTDARLSPRECEVLALVANGHSSREIAAGLGLSIRTVENHRGNIMRALGARNTADLTREAMRLGLVSISPTARR